MTRLESLDGMPGIYRFHSRACGRTRGNSCDCQCTFQAKFYDCKSRRCRVRHFEDAASAQRWKESQREAKRVAKVKAIGGSVSDAYSSIRKSAQSVDRAYVDASDTEVRSSLSSALSLIHAAEDEIVRALGVE